MLRLKQLLLTGLVVVLLLCAGGIVVMRGYMLEPVAALTEPVLLEVVEGDSAGTVASRLHSMGLLKWPRMFGIWARLLGDAGKLKVGEYEILPGSSRAEILAQIVAGRVKLHSFTIVEGWTWREVRDAIRASEVIQPTLDYASAERLAAQLVLDPDLIPIAHVEGALFPDTYRVPRGTTDAALLAQAAELMRVQLQRAWQNRQADLPVDSPYALLILASIIERETALDAERAEVAGVFVRRMQKRMRLQTDPTVIYGLGEAFDGNLTRRHLATDTPYNTYTRRGLPPTPIAMPGMASLQAAANPGAGDALYFVASGEADGGHVFSATLEEHNTAVAAYLARLRQLRRENK